MGKINILDSSVANLIAAGEVVERPASVVKELVENSIDAGATAITVEIKHGGISLMRITDNGCGIDAGDVGIAFLRHTTSKLKAAEDLHKINTLGFRGEALSSVSAVAKVTLTTKTASAPNATCIMVEGGEMDDLFETGAPDGTTVLVENLFYNTPARMKFLKKDTTEAGYIKDVMERFILANPQISFRFINNGKQVLFSPGDNSLKNAVYTVYGADFAKGILPVSHTEGGLTVEGCIGKSELSRPNRNFQSFYVNERYIKSRIMTVAVEEAYKNVLMGGKFAFCVLNLKLEPELLDVNVHPNKMEVKFSDERRVFDIVYWGVKNALYQKPIIPEVHFKQPVRDDKVEQAKEIKGSIVSPEISVYESKEAQVRPPVQESSKPYKMSVPPEPKLVQTVISPIEKDTEEFVPDFETNKKTVDTLLHSINSVTEQEIVQAAFKESALTEYRTEAELQAASETEEVSELPREDQNANEDYKLIGQLFNTYLIIQQGGKMLMIDQHAAHERLNFERLKKELAGGGSISQMLLMPVVVELSSTEMSAAKENMEFFEKLGFEIEEFGNNAIIIRMTPTDLPSDELKELFIELLGMVMSGKREIVGQKQERALYTIACKAAIKANREMRPLEVDILLRQIFELENINTCPHGRPIMVTMTKYEIEKQFKRIV